MKFLVIGTAFTIACCVSTLGIALAKGSSGGQGSGGHDGGHGARQAPARPDSRSAGTRTPTAMTPPRHNPCPLSSTATALLRPRITASAATSPFFVKLRPASPLLPRGAIACGALSLYSDRFWLGYAYSGDGVGYPSYSDGDGPGTPYTAPPPSSASRSQESSSIQPLQPWQPPRPSEPSASGNLRFEVEPNTAQVYVDGFYVGTAEDVNRSPSGLNLTVGWHRIEFRAPGHETLAQNVTIEANRTISYHGELKPTRP